MNELAAVGMARRDVKLQEAVGQGVLFTYCADVWGENGIAMLGVMAVFINKLWKLEEVLLGAVPFTEPGHTGAMIKKELVNTLYSSGLASRSEVKPTEAESPTRDEAEKVRLCLCL